MWWQLTVLPPVATHAFATVNCHTVWGLLIQRNKSNLFTHINCYGYFTRDGSWQTRTHSTSCRWRLKRETDVCVKQVTRISKSHGKLNTVRSPGSIPTGQAPLPFPHSDVISALLRQQHLLVQLLLDENTDHGGNKKMRRVQIRSDCLCFWGITFRLGSASVSDNVRRTPSERQLHFVSRVLQLFPFSLQHKCRVSICVFPLVNHVEHCVACILTNVLL